MEDLRSAAELLPHCHMFTASALLTEIKIPDGASIVKVGSQDKKIYWCQNGGSDGGSLPDHYAFVPKDNYYPIEMGRGSNRASSIFVASSSGSATVSIVLVEKG
jgi:hypothetical protein